MVFILVSCGCWVVSWCLLLLFAWFAGWVFDSGCVVCCFRLIYFVVFGGGCVVFALGFVGVFLMVVYGGGSLYVWVSLWVVVWLVCCLGCLLWCGGIR